MLELNDKSGLAGIQPDPETELAVPAVIDDPWCAELRRRYAALLGGQRGAILLAVSGGTDSAALLFGTTFLARSLSLRVEVACLDHGLRTAAAGEVEGVRSWCSELGLPFHTARLELGGHERRAFEARARKARYDALERIRRARGLEWIATAHTASDQAETLLMRLSRGSALRGAGAIAARWGRVLRPMLELTRDQAAAYLARLGRRPFEDATNADPYWFRARVRHRLLPRYAEVTGLTGEQLARRLARFCGVAAEDDALLRTWAERAFQSLTQGEGELDAVGVRALERPLRRRVLVRLLEGAGLTPDAELIDRIDAALLREGRANLPGHRCLDTSGGLIRMRSARPSPRVTKQQ